MSVQLRAKRARNALIHLSGEIQELDRKAKDGRFNLVFRDINLIGDELEGIIDAEST